MKYIKTFESFDNGPRYKVGQDVVALSSNEKIIQPRIKGKIYNIKNILFCSGCGNQFLNFGLHADESFSNKGTCKCGTKTDTRGLVWTSSIFYAPLDDLDVEIEKAIEEENYELAATLRDLKINV